jgi:hypothetical protein
MYPQISSTDLNDFICKIDLNPIMALLEAISPAELMRIETSGPEGFMALAVRKKLQEATSGLLCAVIRDAL